MDLRPFTFSVAIKTFFKKFDCLIASSNGNNERRRRIDEGDEKIILLFRFKRQIII